MQHERALDLGRAQAVPRHVDHVVHAARDPVVAVGVAAAAVAGEVGAGVGREVGVHEPLVVAVDRPRLAGPAVGDDEDALRLALQDVPVRVEDLGLDAEERREARALGP